LAIWSAATTQREESSACGYGSRSGRPTSASAVARHTDQSPNRVIPPAASPPAPDLLHQGRDLVRRTGGRVDDVARRDALAAAGIGAQDDERLTRIHSHPDVQVERGVGLVHLGDGGADRERGAHRPLGIVLVRGRRPEHRHRRVADELLHRPAEVLQTLAQDCVERGQRTADVLDVHPLAAAGEADEVGKEHRDHLALLDRGDVGQGRAAGAAEPEAVRVLLTAARADRHRGSLFPARRKGVFGYPSTPAARSPAMRPAS
jgi:hypothetical protein